MSGGGINLIFMGVRGLFLCWVGVTLGIDDIVWSFFPGDNSGSWLRRVVLVVDISSPLVFVGRPGGTKSLGNFKISKIGM